MRRLPVKPNLNSGNPFIPARDRVCRMADTLLIFGLAFAGVSAAIFAIINQIGAMQ